MAIKGVMFGNKHSFRDWGLYLNSRPRISPARAKTVYIDIPGGNGVIDLTESLYGEVVYENRTIECSFSIFNKKMEWTSLFSEIQSYLQGQRLQIILDDDMNYYYEGRAEIDEWRSDKVTSTIVIRANVEPFKKEINSYGQDWLWDPFDFVDGIIYDARITIQGKTEIELDVRRMPIIPTFRATAAMTVTYEKQSYSIPANKDTVIYDIRLTEGKQKLAVTGNGTLIVSFKNGVL